MSLLASLSLIISFAQISQPRNIMPGMRYVEVRTSRAAGYSSEEHWIVGDTIESQGENLIPVYQTINLGTDDDLSYLLIRFIKTEGEKVYILDKGEKSGKRQWLLLYDFGLNPGDWTEVYLPVEGRFIPTAMKCLEIKEDPACNGLLTMTLMPEYRGHDDSGLESSNLFTCKWIVGVGSTRGLFFPTPIGYGGGASLEKVTVGGESLFYKPVERIDLKKRRRGGGH